MHPHNTCWFLTLTYANEHMPVNHELNHRDWQLFAKKTRQKLGPFRFFMCGEYGDGLKRPHYHAAIFGLEIPDATLFSETKKSKTYTSYTLEKLWGKGYISLGELSYQSAGYVASYVTKKINGEAAKAHYARIDPETGEIHERKPEYARMSLKPGIGAAWFHKYYKDITPEGEVLDSKRKHRKAPKYYDKLLKRHHRDRWEDMKALRALKGANAKQKGENSDERLATKDKVLELNLKRKTRNYENDT